jgi:hypothetical protein
MRLKLLGWVDLLVVSDAEQIRWLNAHPDVVRPPDARGSWLAALVNRKTLVDLKFPSGVLPVFIPRSDAARKKRQAELRTALDQPELAAQPASEWLGAYVASVGAGANADEAALGVVIQQWCGRLVSPNYAASRDTYAAGATVASWPSQPPWRTLGPGVKRRLEQARRVVADAAGQDVHVIHATSIGMSNIVRSVLALRALAAREGVQSRSSEDAMRRCVAPPPVLVRGCAQELRAPFLKSALDQRTLIVFRLAQAYAKSGDLDIAFLDDTWSACPASHVVPALLKAVWAAASAAQARAEPLPATGPGSNRSARERARRGEASGGEPSHAGARVARGVLRLVGASPNSRHAGPQSAKSAQN